MSGVRQPQVLRTPATAVDGAEAVGANGQSPLVRLQGAGNGAVVRLAQTLQQERDGAFSAYQYLAQELSALGPEKELDGERKAYHDELVKQLGVVEQRLLTAENDLQLINQPSSDQAVNEMLARRQVNGSSFGDPSTTGTGWLTDDGLGRSSTTTRSSLADGTAVTTSDFSGTTFNGAALTRTSGDTAKAVDGTYSTSRTSSTSRQYGFSDGNIGYSSTSSTSSEQADSATGYSSSSSTSTTRSIGTGGATRSTSTTEQYGSTSYSTESTTGWSRGDGRFGATSSTSTTRGTVDGDGKLTSGSTFGTSRGKGVVAGEDGYGGYRTAGANASLVPAKGIKLGASAAVDGRCTVNVTQVSTVPPKYAIVLTISLGGKVGVSGGAGSSRSGSVSGSASGSVTATFSHLMNETDAAEYLAVLDKPGQAISSGAYREFTILKTAMVEGDDAAAAALRGLQAGLLADPGAANQMQEGDSATIKAEGKVGGAASLGGKGGGKSVGVSGGASASASFTWSVAKKGGMVVLTGTPAGGSSWSAGATGAYGVGSGGYSHESTSSGSDKFTFTLDPQSAGYEALYHQIIASASRDELARIVAEHPEVAGTSKATESHGSTDKTEAGIGPFSLGMTSGSARTSSVTTDNTGKVTELTEEGSGSGGASFSVGGVEVASYNETGTISTTVGSDKTASGDVNVTKSETDLGDTWDQFVDSPLASLVGLVTGSTKVAQHSDVAGMTLSDADYATIAAAAHGDLGYWQKVLTTLRDVDDWNACRDRIRNAGGDRAAMAKALADFVSGDSARRSVMVQHTVRPLGSKSGGDLYEWPHELNAQKGVFDALVDGNPVKGIQDLYYGGEAGKARQSANDVLAMLTQLSTEIQQQRDKFHDGAAYGEMLRRIAARRAEIAKEAKLLEGRVGKPAMSTVPTADEASAEEQAELTAQRESARVQVDALRQSLQGFLAAQTRAFGVVQAEQAKADSWFRKPDIVVIMNQLNELRDKVYPAWDRAYQETVEAAKKAGLPEPKEPTEPKPARAWWRKLHDITFKGW